MQAATANKTAQPWPPRKEGPADSGLPQGAAFQWVSAPPFEFDACRPTPAMIEGVHSLGEKIAPLGDGLLTNAPMAARRRRASLSPR
jgi:hypothetical protein